MRKKRSDFELTDYVCPMSPVLSTRSKLISMIQESKIAAPVNEQLSQSMDSSGEWKSILRQRSVNSSKSAQSECNQNCTTSSNVTDSNDSTNSVQNSSTSDFNTKSDSNLNKC